MTAIPHPLNGNGGPLLSSFCWQVVGGPQEVVFQGGSQCQPSPSVISPMQLTSQGHSSQTQKDHTSNTGGLVNEILTIMNSCTPALEFHPPFPAIHELLLLVISDLLLLTRFFL